MGRRDSWESASPVRSYPSSLRRTPPRREGSLGGSPRRKSPTVRESSSRRKTSRKDSPPVNEKYVSRGRSPRQGRLRPQISRSPSPRNKRSRRDQAEKELEAAQEKENGRNHWKSRERPSSPVSTSLPPRSRHLKSDAVKETGKPSERENERYNRDGSNKMSHRERGHDHDNSKDKRDRSDRRWSGRDAVDEGSSRSRLGRSDSPTNHRHRSHHRSRSPSNSRARVEGMNSRGSSHDGEDGDDSLAKMKAAQDALEAKQKQKPSFELSGKLAAETNRVRGVTLLFTEPPDARKPDVRWRLYVFKNGEMLNEPLYVHRQSCYLFGRERRVADIPTDHPSCSKQHAVLQFRQVEKEKPDGTMSKQVRPYLMDLGSTNKTFLNDNPVEPQRYYELFEKDTVKFGNSSREYVLLHENSIN